MIPADTLEWLTKGADALFVVTAALALYFRWRATGGKPKLTPGERPSWGGEITAERPGGSRQAAERDQQASLWNKFLMISLALAVIANLAG